MKRLKTNMFYTRWSYFGVKYASSAIIVNNYYQDRDIDVDIIFGGWQDSNVPNSYRIPIVAKELFKLYFEDDSTRIWNYVNSGEIPDEFTATGAMKNGKCETNNPMGKCCSPFIQETINKALNMRR